MPFGINTDKTADLLSIHSTNSIIESTTSARYHNRLRHLQLIPSLIFYSSCSSGAFFFFFRRFFCSAWRRPKIWVNIVISLAFEEKRKTREIGPRRRKPECIHKQGICVYVHTSWVHRTGSLERSCIPLFARPNAWFTYKQSRNQYIKIMFFVRREGEGRATGAGKEEEEEESWIVCKNNSSQDDESKSASSYNGVVIFNLC